MTDNENPAIKFDAQYRKTSYSRGISPIIQCCKLYNITEDVKVFIGVFIRSNVFKKYMLFNV